MVVAIEITLPGQLGTCESTNDKRYNSQGILH